MLLKKATIIDNLLFVQSPAMQHLAGDSLLYIVYLLMKDLTSMVCVVCSRCKCKASIDSVACFFFNVCCFFCVCVGGGPCAPGRVVDLWHSKGPMSYSNPT